MSIGDRIQAVRKRKKLTQKEFGALIGVKQTTLSSYEKGARKVDYEQAKEIANICNVSLDWLYNGVGSMEISVIETIRKELENAPMVGEAEFRFYTASFIPVVRMPGISIEETLKEDNIVGRYIKDHNGENKYFAVEVTGDAMLPILKNGDLALIDVERQAFDSDLVCVVTANRYLIRYLAGRQEGKIILKPANSLYPDIAINEEEIKKIYRISETSSITIH